MKWVANDDAECSNQVMHTQHPGGRVRPAVQHDLLAAVGIVGVCGSPFIGQLEYVQHLPVGRRMELWAHRRGECAKHASVQHVGAAERAGDPVDCLVFRGGARCAACRGCRVRQGTSPVRAGAGRVVQHGPGPTGGSLLRINTDGTVSVLADQLSIPTSMEVIRNDAYIVTLTGGVFRIPDIAAAPFGS